MSSRLSQARPAVRPALKARMQISAPSGAGKSRTALTIATEFGGPILDVDTEHESALTYADDFIFDHLPWRGPFDPLELAELLLDPQGYEDGTIIIDSATHFWRGEGGTLDIANGKFTGWKEARPVQEALVKAILQCPAHVILCVRSDMAYEQTEDSNGKKRVDRVGMKPQQDADLVYELNVGLDMDMNHNIVVTKTRTAVLPINRTFRAGRANVVELARTYAEWLKGGEPLLGKAEAEALIEMFEKLPGQQDKILAKQLFIEVFARPEMLRANQLDDAMQWIEEYIARGGPEGGSPATLEDPPQGGDLPPTTTDSARGTTDDEPQIRTSHGGIADPNPDPLDRQDEFEVGDSDPGAPPIATGPSDGPQGSRAKPTPSARQLEAAGATEADINAGIEAAQAMDARSCREYLVERGMSRDGKVEETRRRVAAQFAFERASERPGGSVTELPNVDAGTITETFVATAEGTRADDDAPPSVEDTQALMDEMRGFNPPEPERKPCPVCLEGPGEPHHAAKHEDAEITHPTGTAFWGGDGEVHWTDEDDEPFERTT